MKKNELKPDYNMSYSSLMQLGDEAVILANRDATELAVYGLTPAKISLLQLKTQALKDMRTDEELLAKVSIATNDKNDFADQVRNAVRSIMVRVKVEFGEKSPEYNSFGVKSLDKLTDNDLYRCAKRVTREATVYLPQLSGRGLTQGEIDDLENTAQTFDDKIDLKDTAIKNRDIATEQRIKLSNELYKLITEVFEYGKDWWYSREEAKYNDYIIYDQVSSDKKDIITVPAGQKVSANIENVVNETVFEIENTGKAALSFYVADSLESETPPNALLLDTKEVKIIKADDITNGTYGILIAVNNNTEAEGSFYAEEVK